MESIVGYNLSYLQKRRNYEGATNFKSKRVHRKLYEKFERPKIPDRCTTIDLLL
jgi:hypothetical protein